MKMSKSKEKLKAILNNEQFLSVTKIDGPSLILAGAGSGKTRVITHKIAYLIDCGVAPSNILAVTFTNKAAREMKERVTKLVGRKNKNVMISTFHSLGLKILEKEITQLGYKNKFSIYDDKDCHKLLKEIVQELKLPEDEFDVYDLSFKISHIKMNMQSNIKDETIRTIFKKYQEYLKIYNALDFDDLIKLPLDLFQRFPETLERYQNKWKFMLVDEYQDTSLMQYRMMKLLAIKHRNISVVGDDDQSIYSWRGANSSNITLFERDFYPIYEVKLEQNYRSTGTILQAANSIIKTNTGRRDKNLWTSGKMGDKIGFFEADDEEAEAEFVSMYIKRMLEEGYKYSDIGILFRMNSQSRPLEEAFRDRNIPYKIIGASNFFDRPEIRDILSYMRFLANLEDEVSMMRIINTPKRGIGNSTMLAIMEHAKETESSIYSTIKDFVNIGILGSRTTSYLEDFYNLIEKFRERIFKPKRISKTVHELVEAIDYKGKLVSELKNLKKISYRMNNINQLCQSISRYEHDPDNFNPNIYEYLNRVSLNTKDDDSGDDQVNILSIHASKGLEYKVVFVIGAEEGLMPHFKTVEETGCEQEERRLFYVAVTRAQEKLFMSYPTVRMKFNETLHRSPSPFIDEIPEELLDEIDLEEKLGEKDSLSALLQKWNSAPQEG